MIQRLQSLFLLGSCACALILLFVPSANYQGHAVFLTQMDVASVELNSTFAQVLAMLINFFNLTLSFIIILIYQKRKLQRALTLFSALIWVLLIAIIAFIPLVEVQNNTDYSIGFWAVAFAAIGFISQALAAQYIKRDIELLKQADRIR
jgi:vacuolar-type H+-ATPase subunit I/STV1